MQIIETAVQIANRTRWREKGEDILMIGWFVISGETLKRSCGYIKKSMLKYTLGAFNRSIRFQSEPEAQIPRSWKLEMMPGAWDSH
jgi:hypothetical protein